MAKIKNPLTVVQKERQEVEEKDINFYDYDGTLLYSWTLEELQSKTELPPNPSHSGLTAQGWNWSLEALKSDNDVTDVGQLYITDDGSTRLYVSFEPNLPSESRTISLRWRQTVSNGVTINWGDGSSEERKSGTGNVSLNHTYGRGSYVISLLPQDGCIIQLGNDNTCIVNPANENNGSTYLKKVELGRGFTELNNRGIGRSAFERCYGLEYITVPSDTTILGYSVFSRCSSLRFLVSSGLKIAEWSWMSYNLMYCYSIKTIVTSEHDRTVFGYQSMYYNATAFSKVNARRATDLPTYSLNSCRCLSFLDLSSVESDVIGLNGLDMLEKIIFGKNIKSLKSTNLENCYICKEIHFKAATPFPVESANSFRNLPTSCKIYVPTGSLSAYTSATNYPNPNTYTYLEE